MKYRLDVINDKEFEILAKDLLEAELKIKLQNFRSGKDKGIDLRYANSHENEIIVQAKHYIKSSFSDLKTTLKEELEKIRRLPEHPKRYILVTSFDLNTRQTDEIVELLQPFLRNSQDVYGMSRIQEMIATNTSIENKHYKLWLTSANILQRILHNGVKGRSEYTEAKILHRSKLFVPTEDYVLALEKLLENHVLVITGEPGVGKTTIAYQLIYDTLAKGFELIVADDKLDDAEQLLSPDSEEKQIVLFDDFLGANIYEIFNPRNTENKIINFIERIQQTPNKLLVATTRTTILNQANRRYEKFKNLGTDDSFKYEVKVRAYPKISKAKILYNHIYHALSSNYQDIFFTKKFYLDIIQHPNFFPRLIEFITTESRFKNKTAEEARIFIEQSLANPSEIWDHAYREQLEEEDQFLLCTIFSFGATTFTEEELREAFNSRYEYEIANNGHKRRMDAFNGALKKLSGGFITLSWNTDSNLRTIKLSNPSIADFLLNYIKLRPDEMDRLFLSFRFYEQITTYFGTGDGYINIPYDRIAIYHKVFVKMLPQLNLLKSTKDSEELTILFIYSTLFSDRASEDELFNLIEAIDTLNENIDSDRYLSVLRYILEFPKIKQFISSHWKSFLILGIQTSNHAYEVGQYIDTFNEYGVNNDLFSGNLSFMEILTREINSKFQSVMDSIDYGAPSNFISSDANTDEIEYNSYLIEKIIEDEFDDFLKVCNLEKYKNDLWPGIEFDACNIIDALINDCGPDDDYYDRSRTFQKDEAKNPDDEINNLFER